MKRLLVGALTSIVMMAALTGGIVGAWSMGVRVPGVSGATYLKAVRLHSHFIDGVDPNKPIFVMLVGSDLRPGVGGARGDALHLLAVNPRLHAGTIVDFPRDTCTDVPGRGHVRINEANSQGGPALDAQVVSTMTGAPVSYSVEIDFAGFLGLVDGVGGFNMNVPFSMHDSFSNADFEPGPKFMNGVVALSFARDRHTFGKGDIQRSWNQAYLMLAAIQKLEADYRTAAGRFQLAALMVRHTELAGLGISDLVRLGEIADQVPAANIKNVTIPLQGSGCLDLAPASAALFADVRDDGVLESYPAGSPSLPDPRP